MSKWILPTTKGVETFPQVTRSPLAIRFEGVPRESPLARELYSILHGKIGAFYVKAAHAHSLGITDSSYRFQVTPEMAIRYHNNQGHETLHIKAGREVIEQAIKQAKQTWWDWVLIEAYVPQPLDADLLGTAHMKIPKEADIAVGQPLPIKGFSFTNQPLQDASELYLFGVPTTGITTPSTSNTAVYCSWVVDLLPARGLSAVEVDLNICLSVPYFQPSYTITGLQEFAYQEVDDFVIPGTWTGVGPPYPPDPLPTVFIDPDDPLIGGVELFPVWGGAPGDPNWFPLPEVQFDDATQRWSFVDQRHGPRGWVQFVGTDFAGGDAFQTTHYVHNMWIITDDQRGGHIPVASGTRPGEIQLTLGKGNWRGVFTAEGFSAPSQTFYRWKYSKHDDSARPGCMHFAHDFPVVHDDQLGSDPATRYAIPFTGNVVVDQINWGLSFNPG